MVDRKTEQGSYRELLADQISGQVDSVDYFFYTVPVIVAYLNRDRDRLRELNADRSFLEGLRDGARIEESHLSLDEDKYLQGLRAGRELITKRSVQQIILPSGREEFFGPDPFYEPLIESELTKGGD